MRKLTFALLVTISLSISCHKDDPEFNQLIGKWRLVKGFNLMMGGFYTIDATNQRIEEYTKDNERILYDYLGNEVGRCGYNITDSMIVIYGKNLNGDDWEYENKYWFNQDTLAIHQDGGFEYYNEFFIRIN